MLFALLAVSILAKGNYHCLCPQHINLNCNLPYFFISILPEQARKVKEIKRSTTSLKETRVLVWTRQKPGAVHVQSEHLEMKHPHDELDTAKMSLITYSALLWSEGHSALPSHAWTLQQHAVKLGPKGSSNWIHSGNWRAANSPDASSSVPHKEIPVSSRTLSIQVNLFKQILKGKYWVNT